jgi:hypothetical protein
MENTTFLHYGIIITCFFFFFWRNKGYNQAALQLSWYFRVAHEFAVFIRKLFHTLLFFGTEIYMNGVSESNADIFKEAVYCRL